VIDVIRFGYKTDFAGDVVTALETMRYEGVPAARMALLAMEQT
jgi:uncharacterized Zn-binding protein involved in type VI secretion